MRREYHGRPLRRADLDADPLLQFDRWFCEAVAAGLPDPNAMVLATVAADGQPSSRTVLLKGRDPAGFVFYTNHGSRKAREIADNPRVALLFFWPGLFRQVRVCGTATRCGIEESRAYFQGRPRDSQLGAWASQQSMPIASRSVLEARFAEASARFADAEVPLPPFWGGYRVVPCQLEFWQGQESRLHDRFVYTREGDRWHLERLAP